MNGTQRGSVMGEMVAVAAFVLPIVYAVEVPWVTLGWCLTVTTWVALWAFMSWWSPVRDCAHCGGVQVLRGGECSWCGGTGERLKWQVREFRRLRARRVRRASS